MNLSKITFGMCMLLIMLAYYSCKPAKEDAVKVSLMKSWQLTSTTIDGEAVSLLPCQTEELIYFTNQHSCYIYSACENNDFRTAWEYDSENHILNIADLLPVTYYVETIDGGSMTLKYYKYTSDGKLEKYISRYHAVQTSLSDGKLRLK